MTKNNSIKEQKKQGVTISKDELDFFKSSFREANNDDLPLDNVDLGIKKFDCGVVARKVTVSMLISVRNRIDIWIARLNQNQRK